MTWNKKILIAVKPARRKEWPETEKEQLQSNLWEEKNDLKQENDNYGQGCKKKRMTWNKKITIAVKPMRRKEWPEIGKEKLQSRPGQEKNDLKQEKYFYGQFQNRLQVIWDKKWCYSQFLTAFFSSNQINNIVMK